MAQQHIERDVSHSARAKGAETELIAGRRRNQVADEEWRRKEGAAI
jgi:hypothetical protein